MTHTHAPHKHTCAHADGAGFQDTAAIFFASLKGSVTVKKAHQASETKDSCTCRHLRGRHNSHWEPHTLRKVEAENTFIVCVLHAKPAFGRGGGKAFDEGHKPCKMCRHSLVTDLDDEGDFEARARDEAPEDGFDAHAEISQSCMSEAEFDAQECVSKDMIVTNI